MIGVVPAAGCGQRIQPLGCSKELLPVGWRTVKGHRRPKAVIEYLLDRMIAAGTDRICFIISPEKSDIIRYLSDCDYPAEIFYVIQPQPEGLCDAIFRAAPFARDREAVLIGLPDTIWFPTNGFSQVLRQNRSGVNLLLFPTETPSAFDAVVCSRNHAVQRIEVKQANAASKWIWGAVTSSAECFRDLKDLWEARGRADEYLGDLLNAYLAKENVVKGYCFGETYLDVGTVDGFFRAQDFLRHAAGERAA